MRGFTGPDGSGRTDPSSDLAALGHLLPQGEKEEGKEGRRWGCVRVWRNDGLGRGAMSQGIHRKIRSDAV